MRLIVISLSLIAATAAALRAQPAPDYGYQWSTIGDPGNTQATPQDYFLLQALGWGPIGCVDYEYRMARTEVSTTQWVEFVDAYTRINPAAATDIGLLGDHIYRAGGGPGNYQWAIRSDAIDAATNMQWYFAARYCNWLHNGKVNESWAFENGAYDSSTWMVRPDGTYGGQLVHTPGAKFWIPTLNEWTKGMHWDPNKNGPGLGGYWLYPHSSNVPPVGGLPGTPGAETGAGMYDDGGVFRFYPVGSYPTAQSPWGLLDGSGGISEWMEFDDPSGWRHFRGSVNQSSFPDTDDRLDAIISVTPEFAVAGLRLASVVPAPGSACVSGAVIAIACRRTRRR